MKKRYRYYCLERPAGPGAIPRGVVVITNFDQREMVDEIRREAWGWIEYERALTEKEMRDYELMEAGNGKGISDQV